MTIEVKVYGKKSWSQSFRDRHIHKRKMTLVNELHYAQSEMIRMQQDPRHNYGGFPIGRSVLADHL